MEYCDGLGRHVVSLENKRSPKLGPVERYNLDHGIKDSIEDSFYYEWIMTSRSKD